MSYTITTGDGYDGDGAVNLRTGDLAVAIDLAAGWLAEQHPEHYLDEEAGEQSEDEDADGYVSRETLTERALATLDEARQLARRYAEGA